MKKYLLIGLALAACAPDPTPPKTPAGTPPPPVPVEVARVTRQDVARTLDLPGELRAYQEARLIPRVAGYLTEVRADIGDAVRPGQVLAVVEAPERGLETAAAEAQASRRRSETQASLAQIEEQTARARGAAAEARRAGDQVAAAQAEVAQAQADARLQATTLQRLQGIYDQDAELMPQQDLDTARRQAEVARARVQVAARQLEAARRHEQALRAESSASLTQVGSAEARSRASEDHLRAEQAAAGVARQWEAFREVTAPFAGVVTERGLHPGALVSPSMREAIVVVSDVSSLRLRVGLPELESAHVRRGTVVTAVADALPEQPVEGRVSRVSGAVSPATRTLEVEAVFPNPSRRLRPGLFVRATFALESHARVPAVPTASVVREKKKTFVYMVEAGKAVKKPVEVGYSNRVWTEIAKGLEPGAEVVVKGQDKLTDGLPVDRIPPAR